VHSRICFLGDAQSTHLKKWAIYFRDADYEVTVLSLREGNIPGIRVFNLNPPGIFSKFGYVFAIPKIKRLIGDIKPDILHAFHASSYGFLGAVSGFHPFVISTWGSDVLIFPKKSAFHKRLLTWSLSKADQITATSRFLKKAVEDLGFQDVERVPIGVDTNVFKPAGINDNGFTVLTVRNLEEVYGISYLLTAFAAFSKGKQNVLLKIVGEGSSRERLLHEVKDLEIEKLVKFLGVLPQREVAREMARSDVFVVPSLSESFGVAALEASASGVSVIASNVGGLPEVVRNGETGFLTKPGDAGEIKSKLDKLYKDADLRRSMGKAGREFVLNNYRWSESCRRMESIYKKL
jgi:glycosyltransferase involved in cell wall biosynthesis